MKRYLVINRGISIYQKDDYTTCSNGKKGIKEKKYWKKENPFVKSQWPTKHKYIHKTLSFKIKKAESSKEFLESFKVSDKRLKSN